MTKARDPQIGPFLRGLVIDATPVLSILVLIVVTALPLGWPSSMRLGGLLPLVGISYWSLVRPRAVTSLPVFILGLVTDCVLFSPLGLHAFVFVLSQAILKRQRRFLVGQGFWVLWAAFALVVMGAYGALWGLSALFLAAPLPFTTALPGAAIAWAIVPLLAGLLSGLHRIMDLFDEPTA